MTSHGWTIFVLLILTFLAIGSFLNVVIYRLPAMLERDWGFKVPQFLHVTSEDHAHFNLVTPRSKCPNCGKWIRGWHNIPIISWLFLLGRCHHCNERISPRYPFVEALTLIMSVVILNQWGYQWLTIGLLFFTWCLIAVAFIDYDTQLLPDQITLPLMWGGILSALAWSHITLADSIIGAVVGYLVLWSLYWGFKLATGKEGMGYGDFKFLAALGAWLGWQAIPAIVLMASILGIAYGTGSIALRLAQRNEPIPFGPFLAVAGWVTLIFHQQLNAFAPIGAL